MGVSEEEEGRERRGRWERREGKGKDIRWMREDWRVTSAWRREERVERMVSEVGSAERAAKYAFIPSTTSPSASRVSCVHPRCIWIPDSRLMREC